MNKYYIGLCILVIIGVVIAFTTQTIAPIKDTPGTPSVTINEVPATKPVNTSPPSQKPSVVTKEHSDLGGFGCFGPYGTTPCPDPEPSHVTLHGSYDGHGAMTTTWFEYWFNEETSKQSTPHQLQADTQRTVSETVLNIPLGHTMHYRLVASNSTGMSVGNTMSFPIPIP